MPGIEHVGELLPGPTGHQDQPDTGCGDALQGLDRFVRAHPLDGECPVEVACQYAMPHPLHCRGDVPIQASRLVNRGTQRSNVARTSVPLPSLRPDLELPLVAVRALAHGEEPEVAGSIHAGLGRLDVHAHAVVADHGAHLLRQEGDHHLDVRRLGVLARVVERLLDDPEERLLETTAHADLLADDAQVRVDRVALPELGDELPERRHQAEVVQGHRAEVEDQPPRVIEDAPDAVLEVRQLADHHLRGRGR